MKKPLLLSTLLVLGLAQAAFAKDSPATQAKVAMCIGCHGIPGYQASFPEIHKVPMISGQSEGYLVAALTAYAKGDRKHATMRSVAAALSEQDIKEIAAFYAAQVRTGGVPETAAPASAAVTTLLTKGGCVVCHGSNFSKPVDGATPKLAGQHADYLYVAMKSYRTEGNAQVGRNNGVMVGQVKPFSHAELKVIAGYLASLPSELATVPQAALR